MWTSHIASNMNFPAPLAVLAFLGATAGLVLVSASAVVAWFARKAMFARIAITAGGASAVLYAMLLLGFSLASHPRTLARGEEKYFCEIDCHLAYSVVDIQTDPGQGASYVVTLRTRFDETTISPRRPKDAPLSPSPRVVLLMDEKGHEYAPQAMEGTPLITPLKPGESFSTRLQFTLPGSAKPARLLVGTAPAWEDRVVIGDENSWLHSKTYFGI